MGLQHIENLFRRYRGQTVSIKTMTGGMYEGTVAEITNDYVAIIETDAEGHRDQVFILLHSIEAVLPRTSS